jgi:hypothetical protein
MNMNVFEAVKQTVTTRQAAEIYGVPVNRRGMAVCPFHNDKNPSMKVDKRFHCFACQADGDVIDFTARLFDLKVKDAAEKLAADFTVSYDAYTRTSFRKQTAARKVSDEVRLRQAERHCFCVLSDYLHLLRRWKTEYAPREPDVRWHPLFAEALERQTKTEYLLDILLSGTTEEKALLIAEHGKEVIQIEHRISEFTGGHPESRCGSGGYACTTNGTWGIAG